MSDSLRKFSAPARRVLERAQEEATRFGQNYVGTEHLLLALTDDPTTVEVLKRLGADAATVRGAVETIIRRDDFAATSQAGLTDQAKAVISYAVDEVRKDGASEIAVRHLLIGLLREEDGIAAAVLSMFHIGLKTLRQEVSRDTIPPPPFKVSLPPRLEAATKIYPAINIPPPTAKDDSAAIIALCNDEARAVVARAHDEATRFNHNYIGTEHLLLALTYGKDDAATQIFNRLNVPPRKLRDAVEFIIGHGDRPVKGEIGYTPRSKTVLRLAQNEATRLDQAQIGSEHLLLGLIAEGQGIAAGVLQSMGVTAYAARGAVQEAKAPAVAPPQQPPPTTMDMLLAELRDDPPKDLDDLKARIAHHEETQASREDRPMSDTETTASAVFVSHHPLIKHKLTILRDKETEPKRFREVVNEISTLLAYEACAGLQTRPITVQTPLAEATCEELSEVVGLVPILRSGMGMVDPFLRMLPTAQVWHVGLYREHDTLQPVQYYNKLPGHTPTDICMVLDPMLATGGSAEATISLLKEWGARRVIFVGLIAAPEGIALLRKAHPDVPIYLGAIDDHLNEVGYIVPGLGDAGDRQFGTL